MDEEQISKDIEKTLEIVKDLPDEYRLKTYEILLNAFLTERLPKAIVTDTTQEQVSDSKDFVIPIDVKAFLAQNSLTENVLWNLFIIEGSEVRPIYTLETDKNTIAQVQIACLLALENALMGKEFEFSIEIVRTKVQELDLYDSNNFMKGFKKNYFASYDDSEHVSLSPAGKTELADIIEELAK